MIGPNETSTDPFGTLVIYFDNIIHKIIPLRILIYLECLNSRWTIIKACIFNILIIHFGVDYQPNNFKREDHDII